MTQNTASAFQGQNNTATTAAAYSDQNTLAGSGAARHQHSYSTASTTSDVRSADGDFTYTAYFNGNNADTTSIMNGIVGTVPPGTMYVRALYDYEADDRTSLSFHEGDIIQVITRLESGWWDGVINGVRGWFPSNYCQIISPEELREQEGIGEEQVEEESEEQQEYEETLDEEDGSDHDDGDNLPLEGTEVGRSRADFWIPQATPDGRLFYYNTMTGESSHELPLEPPSSINETGPHDRMNVTIPDRTRPPPEMIARGLTQEEEESDLTSASDLEGENRPSAARVRVSFTAPCLIFYPRMISHTSHVATNAAP